MWFFLSGFEFYRRFPTKSILSFYFFNYFNAWKNQFKNKKILSCNSRDWSSALSIYGLYRACTCDSIKYSTYLRTCFFRQLIAQSKFVAIHIDLWRKTVWNWQKSLKLWLFKWGFHFFLWQNTKNIQNFWLKKLQLWIFKTPRI